MDALPTTSMPRLCDPQVSTLNSRELLRLYQDGHSEAATLIFERYASRLISLARAHMAAKLKRRVDPEDVVQSAYRSFFLHARENMCELVESGDLWRLLVRMTLNKLHRQIEWNTASRRSIQREEPIDPTAVNCQVPQPSPDEIVAAAEQLQWVLDRLEPEERTILTLRLQSKSIEQMGASIGKSARTVRRLVADVERMIERRLLGADDLIRVTRHLAVDPRASLRYTDYVLERLIGSGGMGKVFLARETTGGKKVAIKAIHKARQSDRRALAHFVQEAMILAKLDHPNIVRVHGLGQFPSGGYFMAMDFVDGADLQSRLNQSPLPLATVLRITKQVAVAIQYAHDQGVVHCDLKPGNVLVDQNELVTVTDFGFAFLLADSSRMIEYGLGGTWGYIAPEVLFRHSLPTPAADVYGLGMLMWTLATGKSPDDFTDHQAVETLGSSVSSICRRCLASEPHERYRSAEEIAHAIAAIENCAL
jgi:RNA polymerase sigma factor (sigma-70 family)